MWTLELLDDISATVCNAADSATMCQSIHPDARHVENATNARAVLHNYIGNLNTNVDIYKAILRARKDPEFAALAPEYKQFADQMQNEFEMFGIHLGDAERRRLVQKADEIKALETDFLVAASDRRVSKFEVPTAYVDSLPKHIRRQLPRLRPSRPDRVVLDTSEEIEEAILKWTNNDHARRLMYENAQKGAHKNVPVLEQLLSARHDLATQLNHKSFAHLTLGNHIAGTPDGVLNFLTDLSTKIKPKLDSETAMLMDMYKKLHISPLPDHVKPWDKAFLINAVKASKDLFGTVDLSEYLSLENCLAGLSVVSNELFGLKLRQVTADKDELWDPSVIKMEAWHEKEGLVGTIYFDLYARPSKLVSTANYPLKFAYRDRLGTQKYHIPSVALVCSFSHEHLSISQLQALFHEYGHCLHTLLSRTEFQHHAGTRGAMDWIETPSTLMEHFATDHRVLERFAFHHDKGTPVPKSLLEQYHKSQALFSATTTLESIFLSTLDQHFHGPQPPTKGTTTDILARAQLDVTGVPHHPGTYPHGTFTHLATGYAASYYSYLFARSFSSGLWRKLFKSNPLSREAGEKYRQHILSPGGSGDPLSMLTAVLGQVPTLDAFAAEIVQPNTKYSK